MRIERINDNQLKFTLMQKDLEAHSIKINELFNESDKVMQLLYDMMQVANDEYSFDMENTNLMVESLRVGVDSVVIMVTKISEDEEQEDRLNLLPFARKSGRFKRKGMIKPESTPAPDSHAIFSFTDFDTMAHAANELYYKFEGVSQVYKFDGLYYLMVQNETPDSKTTPELEAVLNEFGQKHVSNVISQHFIIERGEEIIKYDAVEKLNRYFTL